MAPSQMPPSLHVENESFHPQAMKFVKGYIRYPVQQKAETV